MKIPGLNFAKHRTVRRETSEHGETRQSDDVPVDVLELFGVPEVERTPRVFQALGHLIDENQQLRREIVQMREYVKKTEQLADRDPLLDVLNRRAFMRELERARALNERHGLISSLLYVDVNDLKLINDTYGHGAGDAALREVVDVLVGNFRKSDIVARIGGDEFAVILLQTSQAAALEKAGDVVAAVKKRSISIEDQRLTFDAAFGAAQITADKTADELLREADAAMYQHKKFQNKTENRDG